MPSTVAPSQRPAALAVRRALEAALRLTHPVEARISPDGRTVAVTAAGPHGTSLVLASVPASLREPYATPQEPVPVHRGDTSVDRHSPRWLPDSRTLLHIAEPAGGGHPELAALDTATGTVRTVAAAPGAVEDLLVSDDGLRALLLCAEDGAERDGMHLGLPVRLGAPPAPERFAAGLGLRSVWTVDLADGTLRAAGPRGLTVWNVAWRGGTTAVATVSEESLPSGYYDARFVALDLAARTARTLHRPDGQLGAPAMSRDGRLAAVCEGISIVAGRPVVVDLATGGTRTLAGVEDATWLGFDDSHDFDRAEGAATDALRWAGWQGTGSRIGRAGATLWSDAVTLGGAGYQPALSLDAAGRLAATVLDAPGRPPEAVVARTDGPEAWRWTPVTSLNSGAYEGGTAPVRTRGIDWVSDDGRTVHGLLLHDDTAPGPDAGPGVAPADAADACAGTGAGTGERHAPRPLAVLLHGGPAWLWSSMYAPADVLGLAPALAAAGYLVLLPNPRGSNGRGRDHARAVVGDTGGGDLADVLSGVRHLVGLGLADPRRTAVLGHSYGGYLAALAAARTDVFAAAVVVSAPTDWLSFTHTSNIGGGYDRTYRIGGTAQDHDELRRRSAVFAHGGSGTPTLVVHGAADRVTPVGQAHELYRSLLRAGRAPAELLVYPDEGHEFTDPDHLLDAAARAEEWLHTHLGAPIGTRLGAPIGTRLGAPPGTHLGAPPGTRLGAPLDSGPDTPPGGAPPAPPSSAAAPQPASPGPERGAASPAVPEEDLPRSPSGAASPLPHSSHSSHSVGKERG